jgi:hypothetical protein
MAGKKVNRFDPKNIEAKRTRKRAAKAKATEEVSSLTAAAGQSVKPAPVEKPAVERNVPGFTQVPAPSADGVDIQTRKRPEEGVGGAEGAAIKKVYEKRLQRQQEEEIGKVSDTTPAELARRNAELTAGMPYAETVPNPIPAETLREERTLRPTLKEDTRPARRASFTPAPGKTQPFTPLSQSQSESIPLTGTTDIAAAGESRARRAEKGMGIVGSEAGTEVINHPVHGNVEVTKDLAEAHRLYAADYAKDPIQANKKALGTQEAKKRGGEFLHPGEHAGRAGGYQTLARVRMLSADSDGSMPVTEDHVKKYAKSLGLKYTDALTGIHDSLMNEKRSTQIESMAGKVDENTGTPWLHPQDTWTHPETGEKVPVNGFHPDAQRLGVTDQNGSLSLGRAKGTVSGMYKDPKGKMHVTNPVYMGWNREGEAGKPGNWSFQGAPTVPEEMRGADGVAAPVPISKVLKSQLTSDKKMKLGSTEARKMIGSARSSEAAASTAPKPESNENFNWPATEQVPYTSRIWEEKKTGGRRRTKKQEQGITGNSQDEQTGQYGTDATGAGMPTPPKVGRKGSVRAYIRQQGTAQEGTRDPLRATARFTQVSPVSPGTVSFAGRSVTTGEVAEGPQPAFGASKTPLAPKTEAAKAEQMSIPGLGTHGMFQNVGMPTVRVQPPGTIKTIGKKGQDVYSVRPATFRPTTGTETSQSVPAAKTTNVGEPADQPFLPFGDHKSGRQWLGSVGLSDKDVATAARQQDVVDETRARPIAASLGSVVPPVRPSETLRKINLAEGTTPEAPLPGAVKASKRLAATEKPVKRGRAGMAKNEVSGIPIVGK